MKFFQALVAALVGGFVLTLAAGAHAQSDSKPGYATIVRIQGEARYSPDGDMSHAHPLTVGQTLGPGSVIQTAADSMVDVVLGEKITDHLDPAPDQVAQAYDAGVRDMVSYSAVAEQNVIRMEADTVLAIDKLFISNTGADTVNDTELDLRQGTIFGNVKKLSAASQYVIKTPNGIAGVRGTTFMMGANGDITVISGSMVASHVGPNGQITTVVLGPGDQYDPRTGQVTHLTPQQLRLAERTAVFIITLERGIISFARDRTIIFISPTHGHGGGGGQELISAGEGVTTVEANRSSGSGSVMPPGLLPPTPVSP
jgi:hypothetical protein